MSLLRVGYVKWHNIIIPIPYFPLFFISFIAINRGGEGTGPCDISYASDSGVARICQRAGECVGGGTPPPTVNTILEFNPLVFHVDFKLILLIVSLKGKCCGILVRALTS